MGSIRDERAVVALRTLVYVVPLTTRGISTGPAKRRAIRVPVPSETSTPVAAGFLAANRTLAPDGRTPAGVPGLREATGPYRFSIAGNDHPFGKRVKRAGTAKAHQYHPPVISGRGSPPDHTRNRPSRGWYERKTTGSQHGRRCSVGRLGIS